MFRFQNETPFYIYAKGRHEMTAGKKQKITGFGARAPKNNSDSVRDNIKRTAAIFRIVPDTERAVDGLDVDSYDLAAWLIEQEDPGWMQPKAMRRWAEIIAERGFQHFGAGAVAR